jgi:hypothetical protein
VLLHEPDQRVQHYHAQDPERQHQVRWVTRRGQEINQERQRGGRHQHDSEHVGELGGQLRGHAAPPRAGQRVRPGRDPPPGRLVPAQAPARATQRSQGRDRVRGQHRWVALSDTTLSMMMATIDASIVIISMPAIFRGIGLDPFAAGNITYLLWMIMG